MDFPSVDGLVSIQHTQLSRHSKRQIIPMPMEGGGDGGGARVCVCVYICVGPVWAASVLFSSSTLYLVQLYKLTAI